MTTTKQSPAETYLRYLATSNGSFARMPIHQPTHKACGHRLTDADYATLADGTRYLARDWQYPCLDCQRAIVAGLTSGLPALVGSEKQVAWATEIRINILASFKVTLDDAIAKGKAADVIDPLRAKGAALAAMKDQASWWIDNKTAYGLAFIRLS